MSGLDEMPAARPGSPSEPQGPPSGEPGSRPAPRRRRLLVRLFGVFVVLALLLAAGGTGTALLLQHHWSKNIQRFGDPFSAIPQAGRPKIEAAGAENILMLGSDSRISGGDPSTWVRGAQRTDSIMIAHIPADRSAVTVVSIPRDSWVTVPGHGKNKINAGFSFGGPALEVQTVENLTGVRIDHVVIVDFDGFKDITDELGGVQVDVPKTTGDGNTTFKAGLQTMNGDTALDYVRQRHNLPGGDFDRVKRQQNWLRAVGQKTLDKGTLTNPFKVSRVLNSLTKSLAADDGFSIGQMRSLVFSLRSVRGSDLAFVTVPVTDSGRSPDGKQNVVNLDVADGKQLWRAMADDTMPAWLAANPRAALGSTVR